VAKLKGNAAEQALNEEGQVKRKKKAADAWLGCPAGGSGGYSLYFDKHTRKQLEAKWRALDNFAKYSTKQPTRIHEEQTVNKEIAREMAKKPASHGGAE
jgi:hypothetical protein